MLKAAWHLDKRILYNIEKHENHLTGKKWPKRLQTTKQTNKIMKFIP